MAKVKVWYDPEGDFLEVTFKRKEGYFRETSLDQVMEKVDMEGNVIGFNYGPRQQGLRLILLTAIEFMIFILKNGISPIFKTKYSENIDSIYKEFILLYRGT